MTDRINFLSAMSGRPHEHVPVYLFDITLGMEVAGIDTDTVFSNGFDGEKSARSLLALQKYLGYDAVNGSISWLDTRIFGGEIITPKKGIPYICRPALKDDPGKLYRMDVNNIVGPFTDQVRLSYSLVRKGTDAGLVHHAPSPFGASSSFRGLEYILMDIIQEPSFVKDLLKFSFNAATIVSEEVYEEVPVDVSLISGAYDNIDIVGKELLDEFSTPFLSDLITNLKKSGSLICFHPHGELSSEGASELLKDYVRIGVENLYYGENNDPLKIHEVIPDMPLMGGIDTFTTIVLGNNDRVRKETKDYVEKMKGIDFTFSCSCSVDRGLPIDRIKTMVDTVRSF